MGAHVTCSFPDYQDQAVRTRTEEELRPYCA